MRMLNETAKMLSNRKVAVDEVANQSWFYPWSNLKGTRLSQKLKEDGFPSNWKEQRCKCWSICQCILNRCQNYYFFFLCIITGDETIHYDNWKTKCQSMDWKPLKLPMKKKLHNDTNSDKSNARCCFGGFTNPILEHYEARSMRVRGLSGKCPAILNTLRASHVALM